MMVTEHRVGGSKCDSIAYFKVQIIKYGLKISEKSVLQGADRTPSILQSYPTAALCFQSASFLSGFLMKITLERNPHQMSYYGQCKCIFSLFLINVIAPRIFFLLSFTRFPFRDSVNILSMNPRGCLLHSYFFWYYHQVFAMPLKGVWCVQMARWLKVLASFPEDPHLIPSIHNPFSTSTSTFFWILHVLFVQMINKYI